MLRGYWICCTWALLAPLAAVEGDAATWLTWRHGEPIKAEQAGIWERQADGALVELIAGTSPALAAGAYRDGSRLLLVRPSDDLAGHAESLVGLPVQREPWPGWPASDPWNLPLTVRRLAFTEAWQTVSGVRSLGGLAGVCITPWGSTTRAQPVSKQGGWHYALDVEAEPIRWGFKPEEVSPGDILSGQAAESGIVCILVHDRGRIGYLDPEDLVLVAQDQDGIPAAQVVLLPIGRAVGTARIALYRPDPQRIRASGPGFRPGNPIWGLSPTRQWMTAAGMAIIILVLFRRQRRQRGSR